MLGGEDAAWVAREVAVCAQAAAHREAREKRKSNVDPMIARETEAAWQLSQITSKLVSLT
jgi:hypothetical protein